MFLLYVLCANMFVLELYIFALCFYAALVSAEDCSEKEHPNLDMLKGDRVVSNSLLGGLDIAMGAGLASSVVGAAKTAVGAAGAAGTVVGAAEGAVQLKKSLSEE